MLTVRVLLLYLLFSWTESLRISRVTPRKASSALLASNEFIDVGEGTAGESSELYTVESDDIPSWGVGGETERILPRLHANSKSLMKWIVRHGGMFNATIQEANDGWQLYSDIEIPADERGLVLLRVSFD